MGKITNVRKAVATLANKLNAKIKNLSAAFTRAWQIVKAQLFLQSKVAGGYIRQQTKGSCKAGKA